MKQLRLNSSASWQKKLYSFTLIELLVVIAIIAILAAILLPALQQARARSLAAGCTNNSMQMGKLLQTYYDTYEGYTPYGNSTRSRWWHLQHVIPGISSTNRRVAGKGTPGVSKAAMPLFYCPQFFKNPHNSTVTGDVFYTWIDNAFFSWSSSPCISIPKITMVVQPSRKFAMIEVGRSSSGGIGSTRQYWNNKNVFPHSGQQNVLHYDGHTAAYPCNFPYFNPNLSNKDTKSTGYAYYWKYNQP